MQIDADHEGGNVIVERIDGDTVRLRQDLRDTQGWWFYWSFRVRGAAGRKVTFEHIGLGDRGRGRIGVNIVSSLPISDDTR